MIVDYEIDENWPNMVNPSHMHETQIFTTLSTLVMEGWAGKYKSWINESFEGWAKVFGKMKLVEISKTLE